MIRTHKIVNKISKIFYLHSSWNLLFCLDTSENQLWYYFMAKFVTFNNIFCNIEKNHKNPLQCWIHLMLLADPLTFNESYGITFYRYMLEIYQKIYSNTLSILIRWKIDPSSHRPMRSHRTSYRWRFSTKLMFSVSRVKWVSVRIASTGLSLTESTGVNQFTC